VGGVDPDAVSESTAGVDGYAEGLGAAGHEKEDYICRRTDGKVTPRSDILSPLTKQVVFYAVFYSAFNHILFGARLDSGMRSSN
jgi:hypothetical protein